MPDENREESSFYKSKGSVYPTYAEFLEALIDGDSRAFKIIFEKALDKLE